jgi:hypothetical protein
MAYQTDKEPEPHFTVRVVITEVVPAWRTGSGPTARDYERRTDDVLNVVVRGTDQDDAITRAIGQLETARDS